MHSLCYSLFMSPTTHCLKFMRVLCPQISVRVLLKIVSKCVYKFWPSTIVLLFKNLCQVAKKTAFSVFCSSTGKRGTKYKVKCITLNYENSKVVNVTALRNMILENAAPVHVQNPKKIKRKQGDVLVSEPETKE